MAHLLSDTDLQQKALQTRIWNILDGKGVWNNLRQVYQKFQAFDAPNIMKTLKSNMLNIGTMSRQLDGNVEGVFYKNFYDNVNYPISTSRGAYRLGRTYEKLGNKEQYLVE